jgi:aspartate-semialdehyde dehydrogenase
MPLDRDSHRIVIAGASSLLGAELKSLLEESRFAASDFRLLDEELAAGTLTEAGGEAAVIQTVEDSSFTRARFIFFTGSADFTRTHANAASRAGANVVDLSGALAERAGTVTWFPGIDALRGGESSHTAPAYAVPSAGATAAASLSLGLQSLDLKNLVFICFQPVSEAGRAGIEELESQTSQLLSFQNTGKPVFDTQVAFTLLDRFGSGSAHKLAAARQRIRSETRAALAGKAATPAVQIVHAPVFYGTTFAACATLEPGADPASIAKACKRAGFAILDEGDAPSSVTVAGENFIQLAVPEADSAEPGTWWFWGAADNIRLPAANAVKLAELLSL